MHYEHLIGEKFNFLTILSMDGKDKKGQPKVSCQCICGKIKSMVLYPVKNGRFKSCGCKNKGHTRHGQYQTKVYYCWQNIRSRCKNKNNPKYKDYGGRGITVYEPWDKRFENFLTYIKETIGEPPTTQHTIDRIDNNGNYEPGNIKWSTPKEQANNTRRNRLIEFQGKIMNLSQWSEFLGIKYNILSLRINIHHWDIERAFTQSIRPPDKHF